MKRAWLVALALCACQQILDEGDAGTGGGSGGGSIAAGGGAAGGAGGSSGGQGGGVAGGAAGGAAGGTAGGSAGGAQAGGSGGSTGGSGGSTGGSGGGSPCIPTGCDGGVCTNGCGARCYYAAPLSCMKGVCETTPVAAPDANFTRVSGADLDDVWVAQGVGRVHHWKAGQWSCVDVPDLFAINDLWASPTGEVWVVGSGLTSAEPAMRINADGGLTAISAPVTQLTTVVGTGGAVFAAQAGNIYRFSNGTFVNDYSAISNVQSLQVAGGTVMAAGNTALHRLPAGGGWATETVAGVSFASATPLFDGGRGIAVAANLTTHVNTAGGWPADGTLDSTGVPGSVVVGPLETYAVTGSPGNNTGTLWRRDPVLSWGHALDVPRALNDVWASADGGYWYVGEQATVARYHPALCPLDPIPVADAFTGSLSSRWQFIGQISTTTNGLLEVPTVLNDAAGVKVRYADAGTFFGKSVTVQVVTPGKIDGTDTNVSTILSLFSSYAANEDIKLELCCGDQFKIYVNSVTNPEVTVASGGRRWLRIYDDGMLNFEAAMSAQGPWLSLHRRVGGPGVFAKIDSVALTTYTASTSGNVMPAQFDNLNRCP